MLGWTHDKELNLYKFELELWSGKIEKTVLPGGTESFWAWSVEGPCTHPGRMTMRGTLEEVAARVAREVGEAILAREAVLRVKNGLTQFFLASSGFDAIDQANGRVVVEHQ